MAFLSIFEYVDGMNICVDRTNAKNFDTAEDMDRLDENDFQVLKFIYKHGLVTTKFIDVYKRQTGLVDYGFKGKKKQYEKYGLVNSCYIRSPNGERSITMYMLTEMAADYIKGKFGLEASVNSGYILRQIEKNDAMGLLKRMALVQFLICSLDVKDYRIVTGELYDAVIEYNDDPVKYYVRVVRCHNEDIADVKDFVKHVDNNISGKRAAIILCEYVDLIIDVGRILDEIETNVELYYQTDIFALDFPETFQDVEVNGNSYKLTDKRDRKSVV